MAVQVTLSDLKQKVEEGWKRDALAEHFGLPKQQMSALLKQAQLRIRKFHAPKFELIDDTVEAPQQDINDVIVEDVQAVEASAPEEVAQGEPVSTSQGETW